VSSWPTVLSAGGLLAVPIGYSDQAATWPEFRDQAATWRRRPRWRPGECITRAPARAAASTSAMRRSKNMRLGTERACRGWRGSNRERLQVLMRSIVPIDGCGNRIARLFVAVATNRLICPGVTGQAAHGNWDMPWAAGVDGRDGAARKYCAPIPTGGFDRGHHGRPRRRQSCLNLPW